MLELFLLVFLVLADWGMVAIARLDSDIIASKSIAIYRMTWEALSPSPFACTLSGLTRLG